ncbi:hypothetical protein [Longimicrobium sp.]|uniref:hypothetical protein n=1 Tax=Longimicrobium sp. TaxID=2029185 RepID=UPI002E3071D2|nr:hypothetical protein [Longimicrobium sp.]HEX6039999.1 hypothetical protein [Longimicrobium sp.]
MKITMRSAIMAGTLAVLLSACGDSPTSNATVDPAGPSYDGGYIIGSGNRTVPTDSSETSTSSSQESGQGGYTIGTGN